MINTNPYQLIPKVDEILEEEKIIELARITSRKLIVEAIREELNLLRSKLKEESIEKGELLGDISKIPEKVVERVRNREAFRLRKVINATGVVIHTNLGRSLINKKIMENISEVATNYSNLEYDLRSGKRGLRYDHLEDIIREITGGEAAMVVNNNAAAVLLVLSTLAKGKEAIVSRGELIEIGGSFRIPDVMEESGAELISVGTTNKTHLRDYEGAINENTGLLLKVHTSNYRILGFTSDVDSEKLSELRDKYKIPLVEDLGSGTLIDLSKYGLEYEPTVQESLGKGVDVVTFSGDKLLGGPQAGIIVGKKEYIDKMKKNPLTRAFRVDKFTISALEAVLGYYRDEEKAVKDIPTLYMLTKEIGEIEEDAKEFLRLIESKIDKKKNIDINIEDSYSEVGGGSLPLEKLDTKCITISLRDMSSQALEEKLRLNTIPIITRLYKDKVYIDLRTIKKEEHIIIVEAIDKALENLKENII